MRIAVIGQQAFGKAALDAFIARGHQVAGVFVPPEAPGARPDPLKAAATEYGLPVASFRSYSSDEARDTITRMKADLGVMAFVTQFVPQTFCLLPRFGTIQFHPSLLPLHRGPSSINWAIMTGRTKTGLTIFRPSDGLDEGAVLLQKEVAIGPDDTLGSVYFDRIFPLGVAALIEAAEAVIAGTAREVAQDESLATYEGWVREAESHIDWAMHIDRIYDLVRGCNPAPGAWTRWEGKRLQLFDARKIVARTFGAVKGLKPGQVAKVEGDSFTVCAQGGLLQVARCRIDDGKKIAGNEAGIAAGAMLGG
ncbi:MAG TPA: methionyl-tRNA formyltransferase [Stellaceae bacterium]|nr:methionyl-tRNA formyltransferase [Stellaceae bacterium]